MKGIDKRWVLRKILNLSILLFTETEHHPVLLLAASGMKSKLYHQTWPKNKIFFLHRPIITGQFHLNLCHVCWRVKVKKSVSMIPLDMDVSEKKKTTSWSLLAVFKGLSWRFHWQFFFYCDIKVLWGSWKVIMLQQKQNTWFNKRMKVLTWLQFVSIVCFWRPIRGLR